MSTATTSYARRVLDEALAVIRAPGSSPTDWRDAAWVVFSAARCSIDFVGALAADVVQVVGERLGEPAVPYYLMWAIRRHGHDLGVHSDAVARLCDRALREGMRESLQALVTNAVHVPPWRAGLQDDWVQQAVVGRFESGQLLRGAAMLAPWLRERTSVPDWVRSLVQQHPCLVADYHIPVAMRWRLLAAAPSKEGWRLLAAAGPDDHAVASAEFGAEIEAAMSVLESAITDEQDDAVRPVLARWLVQLRAPQ